MVLDLFMFSGVVALCCLVSRTDRVHVNLQYRAHQQLGYQRGFGETDTRAINQVEGCGNTPGIGI